MKYEYRVKEVKFGGEWKWTPQYRPKGSSQHWKQCLDDNGDKIYRNSGADARHWLFWEEGSHLYDDAGLNGNTVSCFDRNGKKQPELTELVEKDELAKQTEQAVNADDVVKPKYELFVCSCGDVSHQFVVTSDEHYGEVNVFVEVKLNRNLPWYRRFIKGIKYIFGIGSPSVFGDYDEIILDKSHIEGLQKVIEILKRKED